MNDPLLAVVLLFVGPLTLALVGALAMRALGETRAAQMLFAVCLWSLTFGLGYAYSLKVADTIADGEPREGVYFVYNDLGPLSFIVSLVVIGFFVRRLGSDH